GWATRRCGLRRCTAGSIASGCSRSIATPIRGRDECVTSCRSEAHQLPLAPAVWLGQTVVLRNLDGGDDDELARAAGTCRARRARGAFEQEDRTGYRAPGARSGDLGDARKERP